MNNPILIYRDNFNPVLRNVFKVKYRSGSYLNIGFAILFILFLNSCNNTKNNQNKHSQMTKVTASEILGNPEYLAISYGGYRDSSREIQPTKQQLKEDLRILSAMGIKLLRTYNTHYAHASNVLEAISELMKEDPDFEMFVMLGIWIDCENAWKETPPNHNSEDLERNTSEVNRAIILANAYPQIVKILAVGNEAMVKWAENYYVQPGIILNWVNHLQDLKRSGKLDSDIWITSSDNFAAWGGGDSLYHCKDLEDLIKAVDFVSMHTYPMHDTHYNPGFWGNLDSELHLSKDKSVVMAMKRAVLYAKKQYANTVKYVHSIDSTKKVHIGETGWASTSSGHYGPHGSKACDEYKEGIYYKLMRKWTKKENISCFYFEAFDEKWKDPHSHENSENHFGLFTIEGKAKYAMWNLVDKNVFKGLMRGGNPIQKTYNGNLEELLEDIDLPPTKQLK